MLCNQRKIDFNIIAEIAARRAPHQHILCKAVAVAVADEFARSARIYAVVDHCTAETKFCRLRPGLCIWRRLTSKHKGEHALYYAT